jgi:hypothetical protein
MATTDSRTGFRLPWNTDQRPSSESAESAESDGHAESADEPVEANVPTDSDPSAHAVRADIRTTTDDVPAPEAPGELPAAEAQPAAATEPAATTQHAVAPVARAAAPVPASAARKPNKFLADLTKAMQAAAEAAREDSIARFAADATTFVEQIHTRSAEESAQLSRTADEDISTIRDWSKAEIARIREETEERIADRRTRLERETETHAAQIEHEIERVQGRVTDFETEMARFFERLLAEDDPTRFAALAENLPEPPSFDVAEALAEAAAWTAPTEEPPVEEPAPPPAESAAAAEAIDPWAGTGWSADAGPSEVATPDAPHEFVDPDAAFAAIQAAAEAAEIAEIAEASEPEATEAAEATEPEATEAAEATEPEATGPEATEPGSDPRLEMLGLDPDFAAAEAEAFAIDPTAAEAEEIPPIGEEALAARLAGFMPSADTEVAAETKVTRVVVVGLVSVASIASFKRHLGRLAGVQAVGVSSGPDGEFVFNVTHEIGLVLTESVPTLPGFQARVTGSDEGVVSVTARDPESDA